jgi:hypothetical protein
MTYNEKKIVFTLDLGSFFSYFRNISSILSTLVTAGVYLFFSEYNIFWATLLKLWKFVKKQFDCTPVHFK